MIDFDFAKNTKINMDFNTPFDGTYKALSVNLIDVRLNQIKVDFVQKIFRLFSKQVRSKL